MKVAILYIEFGSLHRSQLDQHLLPLIDRVFPEAVVDLVIIDNSGACASFPRAKVIAGDNSEREFSAWELALRNLQLEEETIVCLCNDTFARNYGTDYLDWFARHEVLSALDSHSAVGYMDASVRPFRINDVNVQRWLRTSLVLIRYADLMRARPLGLPDREVFVSAGSSLFNSNSIVEPRLRQYIEHWLIRGPGLEGESPDYWYKSAELTDENRAFIQSKALSILGELWFSAKLQKLGVQMFDIRRSKSRAFGLFHWAEKFGVLPALQALRRSLRR